MGVTECEIGVAEKEHMHETHYLSQDRWIPSVCGQLPLGGAKRT